MKSEVLEKYTPEERQRVHDFATSASSRAEENHVIQAVAKVTRPQEHQAVAWETLFDDSAQSRLVLNLDTLLLLPMP